MNSRVFRTEDYKWGAKGGYFFRSDLFKFFNLLEKDGKKPVGIVVDDTWDLEIFVHDDPVKSFD